MLLARPYQQDAIDRVRARVLAGFRRILLVMATGGGKCVSPDTLVWSRGLHAIKDLWGTDRICGPLGPGRVNAWHDDGVKDGFKVQLECGLQIDGSPAHRVWVRTKTGVEGWKHVRDLTGNDYVGIARGCADFGKTEIPLDEAYAIGLIVADGCISNVGTTQRLQIDKQRPPLEAILPVLYRWRSAAGGHSNNEIKITSISDYHDLVVFHAQNIREMFIERYGMTLDYSEHREVPKCVLTGTREVVQAFLRGYFDGDGYCTKSIAVSTASSKLADQIHQLLLGLGVYCRKRTKETSNLLANIVEVRDSVAFDQHVGMTLYGLKKDIAYVNLLSKKRNSNIDLVPGVGFLIRKLSCHVSAKWHRNDAWRYAKAYYDGAKMPSVSTIKKLLAGAPKCADWYNLFAVISKNFAWSRVRTVSPSRIHRIDCEVDVQHAFIGNGIINHNTAIAALIVLGALQRLTTTLFVAHRCELIKQCFCELVRAGIPPEQIGIIMAGVEQDHTQSLFAFDPNVSDDVLWKLYARRRPTAPVQLASIDTLRVRGLSAYEFGLIVIDEAHRSLAASYVALKKRWPNAVFLGLTATPYRADRKGLGEFYDCLEVVISTAELMRMQFLSDYRVWTVPVKDLPDLSTVRIKSNGDYDEDQLAVAMDHEGLVGNIVEHWGQHGRGLSTIAFAVNVAHSRHIMERFRSVGVTAEHVDGETSSDDREAILGRFARGETTVLCNCGIATEGYNCPRAKCGVLARPTHSEALARQQWGRLFRWYEGETAVILDHAGNVLEFGLPDVDPEFTLESRKRKKKSGAPPCKTCLSCYAVVAAAVRVCPMCQYEFPAVVEDRTKEHAGDLVEVRAPKQEDLAVDWERLVKRWAEENESRLIPRQPTWCYFEFKEKYKTRPPSGGTQPKWTDEQRVEWELRKARLAQLERLGEERGWKPAAARMKLQEEVRLGTLPRETCDSCARPRLICGCTAPTEQAVTRTSTAETSMPVVAPVVAVLAPVIPIHAPEPPRSIVSTAPQVTRVRWTL